MFIWRISKTIYLNQNLLSQNWFLFKLVLVILLVVYSFSLEKFRIQLENDTCTKSGKFFRAYNEVPTILAILVVTFVITKNIPIIFSVLISLFFGFVMYMIVRPTKQI